MKTGEQGTFHRVKTFTRYHIYFAIPCTLPCILNVIVMCRLRQRTLQAESPSIFLDKSGRGRRLCKRLQDSLIRRSSEKMDESVQFPVGQTGFLLTRMIIHLSGFSTAICMYKCRDHVNCTRANKLSLRVFSWCYRLFTLQNY